jgi:hypothetical protein
MQCGSLSVFECFRLFWLSSGVVWCAAAYAVCAWERHPDTVPPGRFVLAGTVDSLRVFHVVDRPDVCNHCVTGVVVTWVCEPGRVKLFVLSTLQCAAAYAVCEWERHPHRGPAQRCMLAVDSLRVFGIVDQADVCSQCVIGASVVECPRV